MLEITTFSIVVMGLATVILSIFVAYKFKLQSKRLTSGGYNLSNALMWQLVGEALLGGGTTVFAVLAYLGLLPDVPVPVQSMLRVFMFSASSLTTIHLYIVTSRIES
jgi:hypothetical protein